MSGFEVPSDLQQIELLAKMVTIAPQVLKPQNSR